MPPTSQPAPATGADKRPDKRRENIVAYVTRHGTARVEDLARHFEVSPMTVHRDLDHLAAENLLERVRGGARSVSPSMSELGVGQRRQLHRDVKSGLCALAAELVEDGAVVSVDDSTTLESLVTLLPQRSPSALITHSLAAMSLHRQRTGAGNIRLIGCGGQYIPETDSFLGAVTSEQLRRLSADVVFVSTTAVRPSAGGGPAIFHPDTEAAETKRALLDTAPVKVLVVDSTKFGAPGVFKIADVTEFDHVVVDNEISDADRALLENTGATLHVLGEIEGDN
ncbi:MAG: DeoR/GlpR family DNA-binding transcription regulator [Corynebacterium sp.]|uniref:DeoR/GlpR family DNA-binding transcription regulator n=1 Tax=unclassified Corynebacterium TaxID=2624378 RepID=UPI0026470DA9|nr:DeoR/GlpR family DNA-binding transcription regulator [Corynebacterium sp.]MDN5581628.1 DeoR/GlpR family DNA-binding transcription regulator [Corynebacterium sp.]MDN5720774.1 DeoR/GlpR family DNA-binding transcription regulator [Corynebacterium sp.]MDN6325511.1 DeoR/GlpR family DNA-binding transcription regulator [Corynebacterium sp.]